MDRNLSRYVVEVKLSFEPESNQRPMDNNGDSFSASTVHLSTNWAIKGIQEFLSSIQRAGSNTTTGK